MRAQLPKKRLTIITSMQTDTNLFMHFLFSTSLIPQIFTGDLLCTRARYSKISKQTLINRASSIRLQSWPHSSPSLPLWPEANYSPFHLSFFVSDRVVRTPSSQDHREEELRQSRSWHNLWQSWSTINGRSQSPISHEASTESTYGHLSLTGGKKEWCHIINAEPGKHRYYRSTWEALIAKKINGAVADFWMSQARKGEVAERPGITEQ